MTDESRKTELLRREAAFWDRQEEKIKDLYARPHDWRFVPEIADRIIAPKMRFIDRFATTAGKNVKSLLDIGCGNGWFVHMAARQKIKAYGCDLSPKKVEAAERAAREQGLADYCGWFAGDIFRMELPEKVDLISAHGSLHHFPNLKEALPRLVEKFLKPGGIMLFVEPNHEGMSPGWQKFLLGLANSPRWRRYFDVDFYLEVTGQKAGAAAPAPARQPATPSPVETEEAWNIRGESPAGLEFFGEEPDMRAILLERYDLIEEKYFLYFLGHLSNACYIYMKSPFLKRLYRFLLPVFIALDDFLCRFRRYNKWAEEGAWVLKRRD